MRSEASMAIVRNKLTSCVDAIFPVCSRPQESDLHIHVGSPHSLPPEYRPDSRAKLVFYAMSEATRVPTQWVKVLNRSDEVWTPSGFARDAFVNSGVHRPIRIVPLGVECPPNPITRSRSGDDVPFTFMWQGARQKSFRDGQPCDGDRKRGYLVESAFTKAELPNARLILKSLPLEGVSYEMRTGKVWRICKSMSPDEVDELDALVDAFVWPSMGEGFGLPPLEKLSKGIPSFATFWSGPKEYQQDFPLRRLLPDRLQTVRFNGVISEMADVDESTVVELMRYCYDNRSRLHEMRHALFETARKWDVNSVLKPRLVSVIQQLHDRQTSNRSLGSSEPEASCAESRSEKSDALLHLRSDDGAR